MKSCKKHKIDEKFSFLEGKIIEMTGCPEIKRDALIKNLQKFKYLFKRKWSAANNKEDRFLEKNKLWLNSSISFTAYNAQKVGRPKKDFMLLSDRSKRRKIEKLRKKATHDEILYAARMTQRSSGNKDVSRIIKDITSTPTRASKYRKVVARAQKNVVKKHTPSEALSIFVEADLTKRQYEIIYSSNKNVYPCYSLLQQAKKECYPKEESINVTETCAEIKLQDLLDHTTSRLIKYLGEEILESCSIEENHNLELLTKWGCDGSHQSQYKQKFENSADNDAHIFQSSLVPLQLRSKIGDNEKVIWQNPVPSSPRYCRPIRIRFIHETKDVTNEEIKYIENQVLNLKKTEISMSNGVISKVKHIMAPTMVDGKVCNAATDTTSTMRCYICGLTSKSFNDLEKKNEEKPEALKFGLSILHARIRFFESLLHLSYKLPLKKWQIRSARDKLIVAQTKKRIQELFKEKMGLLVDIPKSGFGTTNDGNTSRRFFNDPETAAFITGIDVNLIKRLKIILEVISSGHKIDVEKFENYASETSKLYVELYGWHPMTPTLHKILRHGASVIENAILPIGEC